MSSVPGPGSQPSQGKREGVSQGLQQKTGSIYVQVFSDSQDKGRPCVHTPQPADSTSESAKPAAITSSLSGVGEGGERDEMVQAEVCRSHAPRPPACPLCAPLGTTPFPRSDCGPWATSLCQPGPQGTVPALDSLFSSPKSSVLSLARASLTAYGGSGENVAPKGPSAPVQL